jgi:hypothetical protein
MTAAHRLDGTNEVTGFVYHAVTSYRDDGARRYMAELRESLVRCASVPTEDGRYESALMTEGFAGEESLTYRTLQSGLRPNGGTFTDLQYATVVRVGSVVIILWQYGVWHNDGQKSACYVEQAYLDRFTAAALSRIPALQK